MNEYTAYSKRRACTKKAETAVKVSKMQEAWAKKADVSIRYDEHKKARKEARELARKLKRERT